MENSLQNIFDAFGVDPSAVEEWHAYALIFHAFMIDSGYVCTGFNEGDDQAEEPIVALPETWNADSFTLSFRYTNPQSAAADTVYYLKAMEVENAIEFTAYSSARQNETHSYVYKYPRFRKKDFQELANWTADIKTGFLKETQKMLGAQNAGAPVNPNALPLFFGGPLGGAHGRPGGAEGPAP